MLGMMTGDRVAVENAGAMTLDSMMESGVKQNPDIHAMASVDARSMTVLVSNYHDSGKAAPAAAVNLTIAGVPAGRVRMQHFRVDNTHSNAYEAWKKMGSPAAPSAEQYAALESSGRLQSLESPKWVSANGGSVATSFELPRHGVSLLLLSW
jgi:xylan 1,4-beta-xylosidase